MADEKINAKPSLGTADFTLTDGLLVVGNPSTGKMYSLPLNILGALIGGATAPGLAAVLAIGNILGAATDWSIQVNADDGTTFVIQNGSLHMKFGAGFFEVGYPASDLMIKIFDTGDIRIGSSAVGFRFDVASNSPQFSYDDTAATTASLPDTFCCVYKDFSGDGKVFLACNDGGTIKKVELT